jgi:hypothetical protein
MANQQVGALAMYFSPNGADYDLNGFVGINDDYQYSGCSVTTEEGVHIITINVVSSVESNDYDATSEHNLQGIMTLSAGTSYDITIVSEADDPKNEKKNKVELKGFSVG